MGREVCRAVAAEADLELVAAVDPALAGQPVGATVGIESGALAFAPDLDALGAAGAEVVVDFTHIEIARQALDYCAAHGIHAVVGTSGFTEDDHAEIAAAFTSSNCLIAANFAVGAVLMMRFAEMAAPHFDTAEIIELHHDRKIDAPSGTAVTTTERIAAARGSDFAADPTEHEVYPGARGGTGPAGVRVHSVRMRGMVAHQEAIFGATGQTLIIRQDSYDRESFMPGVVLACKKIADVRGLSRSLDPFL